MGRETAIQMIRHFNRYYTNRLGLLARTHLSTQLTLTEARVILEIGRRGEHRQSALRTGLQIDMGYLNRVVQRLSREGLIAVRTAPDDGRVRILTLTAAGQKKRKDIDAASDLRARELLDGLSDQDTRALVDHLHAAELLLERRRSAGPRIGPAADAEIATARVLMQEYAEFLGADLSFQGFQEELAGLPGKYAPPDGALLLAWVENGGEPAGCVALRKLGPAVCEMKRLFVRPEYRRLGIGRALAARIIDEARDRGYSVMRLDTLDTLESAVALYRDLGFVQIPPYCRNPLPGAMFWEKDLLMPPVCRAPRSEARTTPHG
jgi:putative acetyltransferase